MSIQAVSWVLDHSPTRKLDRLVLISLANHANEAGECWPSVPRIAVEAATSASQVTRVLRTLEEGGHIIRMVNSAPDSRMRGDRRTNLYRILDGTSLHAPPWLERGTAPRSGGVPLDDDTGGRSATSRGTAERAPNHQRTIIEPSEEPIATPNGAKAKRATPFPAEFFITPELRQWATAEVPSLDIHAETAKFADHFRANGKPMKDWKASWRNWMRKAVEYSGGRNGNDTRKTRNEEMLAANPEVAAILTERAKQRMAATNGKALTR